jgi:signal transduction histidine kinase
VDFSHGNFSFFVPSDISLCLFRVLQEAMQNIAKHSHAKNCRVELKAEPNDIVLRIWDSGVGFDTGRLRSNAGLGLISMRERLRLVDGEIRVDSAHAKGTQLEIRVPLRKLPASA